MGTITVQRREGNSAIDAILGNEACHHRFADPALFTTNQMYAAHIPISSKVCQGIANTQTEDSSAPSWHAGVIVSLFQCIGNAFGWRLVGALLYLSWHCNTRLNGDYAVATSTLQNIV